MAVRPFAASRSRQVAIRFIPFSFEELREREAASGKKSHCPSPSRLLA